MNVVLPKGKYIVAVSGGVDSVVLLHMLAVASQHPDTTYIVAHFDHGIRADSSADLDYVVSLAKSYGYIVETQRQELGPGTSEADAREARYEFLRRVKASHGAKAIITAHHQDDLLETMLLHVMRGTGRRGLDPMRSSHDIIRPLIDHRKADLIAYANQHSLLWQEDSTNSDTKYARNAVRANVMPKLTHVGRQKLVGLNIAAKVRNNEIDRLIKEINGYVFDDTQLVRGRAVTLPSPVLQELVHQWLTQEGGINIDNTMVVRVVLAIKTLPAGKKLSLGKSLWLVSGKSSLQICTNDQMQPV